MSFSYFNKLNYTLANEDTTMEYQMVPERCGHVLSVAGSGSRVLPLIAKGPKEVTCVDLSQEQLYLTELRVASAKELTHAEFLKFWGYPPLKCTPVERQALFSRLELSPAAKTYLTGLFEECQWRSILYLGKWEQTFQKISKVTKVFVGERGRGVFAQPSLESQREYLRSKFPWRGWDFATWLMGNGAFFNGLLYKGHFPEKNIGQSYFQYYKSIFRRLFENSLARENYFLQLLVFGEIEYPEGNPVECDPKVYAEIQKHLRNGTRLHYTQGNAVEVAESSQTPIDFFSFSDVPSYFSGQLEKNFLKRVAKGMAQKGLVVVRSYLHVPEAPEISDYRVVTPEYEVPIRKEKTQMYQVDVYQRWLS